MEKKRKASCGETGVKFDPISTNKFSPESRAVTPA